jgi:crossover junction endodeoxyribonuclease RuvC
VSQRIPSPTSPAGRTEAPPTPPASRWPIILGVDPGTRVVGYGAIVARERGPRLLAAGTVTPPAKQSVPERLGFIQAELLRLIAQIRPTVVVVEQAFAARNVQSALRIGEGRGVVLACAAASGAVVVQFAPAVAKRSIAGHGAADKQQVSAMVSQILGLASPLPTVDASDALALALTYLQRSALERFR